MDERIEHGGDTNDEGGSKAHTFYPDGSPALLLSKDGSGIMYYPGGKVAVVVARVPTPNGDKYQRYFYHNDMQSTLLSSLDENAVGFAFDNSGLPQGQRLVLTGSGGVLANNAGKILKEWKWDKRKQGAGTPPEEVKVRLNLYLNFVFFGRDRITVMFNCNGQIRRFECGQQLRRTTTYLEDCTRETKGPARGKIIPNFKHRTIINRQAELVERTTHMRNKNKPSSKNIKHNPNLQELLKSLENHFDPYAERVRNNNFGDTFIAAGWRESAHDATMREVPRLYETKTETGALPVGGELGCTIPRPSKSSTDNNGVTTMEEQPQYMLHRGVPNRWPTELQVRDKVKQRNPTLPQSKTLRSASGRYSIDSPVTSNVGKYARLPLLTVANFDENLKLAGDNLVVILCVRSDDPLCCRAQTLFQNVWGELLSAKEAAGPGGAKREVSSTGKNQPGQNDLNALINVQMFQYHMSESRMLNDRFGVQTLPAFLMIHQGSLVKAGVLGSKMIKLAAEQLRPRVLLLETDFRWQMRTEQTMRRMQFGSELAISPTQACSHIAFRASIASANAVTYYGFLFLDSSLDQHEARRVAQMCRKEALNSAQGVTLVVSLCPMGCVPDEDITEGIIDNPSSAKLMDGICDVAVTRPVKSTAFDALTKRWQRMVAKTRGEGAVEPMINLTHYGYAKADVIRAIREGNTSAQRKVYLPDEFELGMRLPANETVFRGVKLESKYS